MGIWKLGVPEQFRCTLTDSCDMLGFNINPLKKTSVKDISQIQEPGYELRYN